MKDVRPFTVWRIRTKTVGVSTMLTLPMRGDDRENEPHFGKIVWRGFAASEKEALECAEQKEFLQMRAGEMK